MRYHGGKGTWTRFERKELSFKPRLTSSNLRILGSIGFLVSQYVFLFLSREYGLIMFIVSQIFGFPYFIRKGYWDITLLGVAGLIINVAGLVHLDNTPPCS